MGGGVAISRPGELDLVMFGDGEGPSLGCAVGPRIGSWIECSQLGFRHKTQLFYDGHGSSCYRGWNMAGWRCSVLGVLHGMGLGGVWRGVGVFEAEFAIGG